MRYVMLLTLLLLPTLAQADCTGLTMTPCMDAELARIEQRSATYGQNADLFEPPPRAPSAAEMERQVPLRDPVQGFGSNDWTYFTTPDGRRYTNYGHGWVVGPEGTYVPY